MRSRLILLPLASLLTAPAAAYATTYLTTEQAQALMFPGAQVTPDFRTLTEAQATAIRKDSGVDVLSKDLKVWRASTGGWFILDHVVGKHEFITFALALDANGAVKDVEIWIIARAMATRCAVRLGARSSLASSTARRSSSAKTSGTSPAPPCRPSM